MWSHRNAGAYRDESALRMFASPTVEDGPLRADRETPEYKRDQTRAISMYLNDVLPAEERLLDSYDKALARLRSATRR